MATHKAIIRDQQITLLSKNIYKADGKLFHNVKDSDSEEMQKLGFVKIQKVEEPKPEPVKEKPVEEKPKKKKKSIFKKSEK